MGFKHLIVESSWSQARLVDEVLQSGEGDLRRALALNGFWSLGTEETLELLEWLAQYNREHPDAKVRYHGYDIQTPAQSFENLLAFSRTHLPQKTANYEQLTRCLPGPEPDENNTADPETPLKCVEDLRTFIDDFEIQFAELRGQLSADEALSLRQDMDFIDTAVQLLELWPVSLQQGLDYRETQTAQQIERIIREANPEDRFIIWAHNAHVSYGNRYLGHFVQENLGTEQVFNLGFAFSDGEYTAREMYSLEFGIARPSGSLKGFYEEFLGLAGVPLYFLDLRNLDTDVPEAEWLATGMNLQNPGATYNSQLPGRPAHALNLLDFFDTLIYVHETTPSTILPEYFAFWGAAPAP